MDSFLNRSCFFDEGLRFECQRCGACCTGEPGTIYVGPDEILPIAEFLQISAADFIGHYLYPFRDSYSIREHADGRCFCYANGCTIYPVRPNQCKSFPFWPDNLRSETQWKKVSDTCPGIDHGRLYTKAEILEIVKCDLSGSR